MEETEIFDCPANYGENGCYGKDMDFKLCKDILDCPLKKLIEVLGCVKEEKNGI